LFWDYIKYVHEQCGSDLNAECSEYAHKRVEGLDWKQTNECVEDTWSSPNKEDWTKKGITNDYIDRDVLYWARYGSNLFPSVVINNQTYRG